MFLITAQKIFLPLIQNTYIIMSQRCKSLGWMLGFLVPAIDSQESSDPFLFLKINRSIRKVNTAEKNLLHCFSRQLMLSSPSFKKQNDTTTFLKNNPEVA